MQGEACFFHTLTDDANITFSGKKLEYIEFIPLLSLNYLLKIRTVDNYYYSLTSVPPTYGIADSRFVTTTVAPQNSEFLNERNILLNTSKSNVISISTNG